MFKAKCGHDSSEKAVIRLGNAKLELEAKPDPPLCFKCLQSVVNLCIGCGRIIMPGERVALSPCGNKKTLPSGIYPAVPGSNDYLVCMHEDSAPVFAVGHWMPGGVDGIGTLVLDDNSPMRQLMAGKTVIINGA